MDTNSIWKRDFTMVVLGQIISLFGNAILRFALPLYLLDQTGSPALFGLVSACSFVPMIVLSPIGGIVADRINKRNIMVALDFGTAALIVLFSLAVGRFALVPLLIATLMLLYGISGAYQPAVQASLPVLVKPEKLLPANAIINQVNALSGLLGPIVGGILYSTWGLMPILLVSTVCFLFSAVMEIFIHIPFEKQPAEAGVLAIVRSDISDSVRFVRHEQPIFLRVCVYICAVNLALSALLVIGVPVLVRQTLGLSGNLLGIAQGVMAAGGLAGGILAGMLGDRLKMERAHVLLAVCGAALVPMGVSMVPGAPVWLSYGMLLAMCFACMAAATLFSVQMLAYVQGHTPPALIGKVISCLMVINMCAMPVGQALYGVLFEQLSHMPYAIILGGAAATMLTALAAHRTFTSIGKKEARDGREAV